MKAKKSNSNNSRRAPASPRPAAEKYEQVFEKIYRLVLKIPRGRVMTYGQIARLLEDRYSARLVGWAMHATPQDGRDIPWHRVINSKGGISTGRVTVQQPDLQRLLLEAEGVAFDERGHCDLGVYQWSPREKRAAAKRTAAGSRGVDRSRKQTRSSKKAGDGPKKRKTTE